MIRAGVDREASIPLAGPLDPGQSCTPGDTNRCQVRVGGGKYDSYDNCKCITEMKPLRRMTSTEMMSGGLLTLLSGSGAGACNAYPPE